MSSIVLAIVMAFFQASAPRPAPPQQPVPVQLTQPEQQMMLSAWKDMQIAQMEERLAADQIEKNHPGALYDPRQRQFFVVPKPAQEGPKGAAR